MFVCLIKWQSWLDQQIYPFMTKDAILICLLYQSLFQNRSKHKCKIKIHYFKRIVLTIHWYNRYFPHIFHNYLLNCAFNLNPVIASINTWYCFSCIVLFCAAYLQYFCMGFGKNKNKKRIRNSIPSKTYCFVNKQTNS